MVKKEDENPKATTLIMILNKLGVNPNSYKLSEELLNTRFLDIYTNSEKKDKDLILTSKETNDRIIIHDDGTLTYEDNINGIIRTREYTKNGIDLSLIQQL